VTTKLLSRRLTPLLAVVALPTLLLATVGVGTAQAQPILPGTVTCSGSSWSGTIKFTPPLKTNGVSPHEVFTIKAVLGNTAAPCGTSLGGPELGSIKGKLKFMSTASNNRCGTVFSGNPLVATAGAFKLKWITPPGAPTIWKPPSSFTSTGAVTMTDIAIAGGSVTGSFTPYLAPNATLTGPAASWGTAPVTAACNTPGGLASLPIGAGSTGTW
jgi:hypothetical protein